MLQLKHLNYLSTMTGTPVSEIKPLTFGYEITWSAAAEYVLAAQYVPINTYMIVLRTQTYMINADSAASDFQFYRSTPIGTAWWQLSKDAGSQNLQDWTNPNAPGQLLLDADNLIIFPANFFATLHFTISNAAPSGTWKIRPTVFAYFVPPSVADFFGGPQQWVSVS